MIIEKIFFLVLRDDQNLLYTHDSPPIGFGAAPRAVLLPARKHKGFREITQGFPPISAISFYLWYIFLCFFPLKESGHPRDSPHHREALGSHAERPALAADAPGDEERLAAGKVSEAEVSAQQATLAQSRQSEIQAEGNLRMSLLELTQLLELPSPEGFSIVTPEVGDPSQTLLMRPEAIYDEAVEIKPAVEAAEINLDYAKLAITRAKGARLPSISLSGGLGSNYYTNSKVQAAPFGEQLRNNFSQYVGLSLSIPIFQGFSIRNNIRNAELNFKGQEIQLESTKKALYKEIQQAYYNAVTAQARYAGSRESAASARQHYELTEEKYKVGKADVASYNDARNSWLRAESEHIQARFQCLYQTKLLDFYRGRELEF